MQRPDAKGSSSRRMMNPHAEFDKCEQYPLQPSHAILISLTMPEDYVVSLEGSIHNIQTSGMLSNLTRFTLGGLVHGGAALSNDHYHSSRLQCCYSSPDEDVP